MAENVYKFGLTAEEVINIIESAKNELLDEKNALATVVDPNTIAFFEGVIAKKLVTLGMRDSETLKIMFIDSEKKRSYMQNATEELKSKKSIFEEQLKESVKQSVQYLMEKEAIEKVIGSHDTKARDTALKVYSLEEKLKDYEDRIKKLIDENDALSEELEKRVPASEIIVKKDEDGELIVVKEEDNDVKPEMPIEELKILDEEGEPIGGAAINGKQ